MNLPFTRDEFLALFARYNDAVGVFSFVMVLLALSGVASAVRQRHATVRLVVGTGALWIWAAVAYHAAFFTRLSPVGYLFAAAFAAEGVMIVRFARRGTVATSQLAGRGTTIVALSLIAYALILYPLIGHAAGQRYPAVPTFGLPCPTTLFTLGVFVWCGAALPWTLLIVPALWSIAGTSAAFRFGVTEDLALLPAVIIAIAMRITQHRRVTTTSESGARERIDHPRAAVSHPR